MVVTEQFLDIPYVPAAAAHHRFDLHVAHGPDGIGGLSGPVAPRPLLVFVHGGAWRSEDKTDHADLACSLAAATRFPVFVPNYRLTPPHPAAHDVRHPAHAQDILAFLAFLATWDGPPRLGRVFDPTRIYLIGHSCSAHMLASIVLDSSHVSPTLTPPPALRGAVQALITSEGIYDLDLLLDSFPTYREWFIEQAFGRRQSYADVAVNKLPLRQHGLRWLLIHSDGDELVDKKQTQVMYDHLHELIGQRVTLAADGFTETHAGILRADKYIKLVADFVVQDATNSHT